MRGAVPALAVLVGLAAAQANGPERDRIKIGPGTFPATGSLADSPTNPVLIEGAGEGVTTLTRPAAMNARLHSEFREALALRVIWVAA